MTDQIPTDVEANDGQATFEFRGDTFVVPVLGQAPVGFLRRLERNPIEALERLLGPDQIDQIDDLPVSELDEFIQAVAQAMGMPLGG